MAEVQIERVRSDAQAKAVETLAWEFIAWLRLRYPDMHTEIDAYLDHQNFADIVKDVRQVYAPPNGECLLAMLGGAPVGIVMLKRLEPGICEMNRMFVQDTARGHGAGQLLVQTLIEIAQNAGYQKMRLSALNRHAEALGLYRKMGFVPDTSGHLGGVPDDPRVVSLMLDLAA